MIEAQATSRFIRTSAQKAGLVLDLIRGKDVNRALATLKFARKSVAEDISKLLRSAIANATETQSIDPDALYVKKTYVDGGTTLKRFTPRAHGRATPVRKRTSHFTVVVDER